MCPPHRPARPPICSRPGSAYEGRYRAPRKTNWTICRTPCFRRLGLRSMMSSRQMGARTLIGSPTSAPNLLPSRPDCIVPQFGLLGQGAVPRPMFERAVIGGPHRRSCTQVQPPRSTAGVIPSGRMTEQRRRDLAEMCWRKHRTFLVIDEAMVFFLCGERFKRLPVLFRCTCPFTVAKPYTTTSSTGPGRDVLRP